MPSLARSSAPPPPTATALDELLALLPAPARARMLTLYLDLLGPGLGRVGDILRYDPAQAAPLLHKLAGGAAMLQDHPVAQLARAMEAALLDGDVAQALASWPALRQASARSETALARWTAA